MTGKASSRDQRQFPYVDLRLFSRNSYAFGHLKPFIGLDVLKISVQRRINDGLAVTPNLSVREIFQTI